jgi:hypothetical protein
MAGVFGLAGWYFGRKPTSSVSESNVRIGQSAMPWQLDEKDVDKQDVHFKYQYHPHGDSSKPLKRAPSALNEVVVPNVTLPKVCCSLKSNGVGCGMVAYGWVGLA